MGTSGTRGGWTASAWCVTAAFGAYFCMYGYRKPFTAAAYADDNIGDVAGLTVLVTAQVLGYGVSKCLGVKVIAEMAPQRRVAWMLGLIAVAQIALLLFAIAPRPLNAAMLFFNGLPLGMVFGLVLGFLEGRRHTEALAAGLCTSFIVADGFTKSVGTWLLNAGVAEKWMPFAAGLVFTPLLALFAWMLTRVPAPTADDVAERSERTPMDGAARWQFFARYAVGLSLLLLVYLLITILRSVRSDYARNLWKEFGVEGNASVFTIADGAVGVLVLAISALTVCIRDNRRAFFGALVLAAAGPVLVAGSLVGLSTYAMPPLAFMILYGLGLYLPYVVFHTTVFERLIAMTRDRGNIGYLMYLADATGYLGYAALMVAMNLIGAVGDFLDFFVTLSWGIAAACLILLLPCWWYFATHPATNRAVELDAVRT